MLCRKPFNKRLASFGCGQCLPCRINTRRIWTTRLLLEDAASVASSFVTLTYKGEEYDQGSLVPVHLQGWLKRLRFHAGSAKPLRFYGVGEYGEKFGRPHYHVALFGLGSEDKELFERAWTDPATGERIGAVHTGDISPHSAAYIAGYVTKKMTKHDDPRLKGRYPEFARMSLRPGIGASGVPALAEALACDHGMRQIDLAGDVSDVLRVGSRTMPIGRYLRSQLRDRLGVKEDVEKTSRLRAEKMRSLLESFALPGESEISRWKALQRWNDAQAQKALNMETRAKISWSRKQL